MNELLRLEHIQKIYGNGGGVTRAIDDISFSVSSGEFLGIMGASGSGKTTLLNCISTIDTVSAGSILLEGRDITQLKPQAIPVNLSYDALAHFLLVVHKDDPI